MARGGGVWGGESVSLSVGAGRGSRRLPGGPGVAAVALASPRAVAGSSGGPSKCSGPLRAPATRTGVRGAAARRQRGKFCCKQQRAAFGPPRVAGGPVFAGGLFRSSGYPLEGLAWALKSLPWCSAPLLERCRRKFALVCYRPLAKTTFR